MGQFLYQAVDQKGEQINGTLEAVDRKNAIAVLAQKGNFVTKLTERLTESPSSDISKPALDTPILFKLTRHRTTGKDILAMTSQLGTALRAGLPLLNALEIIHQQQHKPAMAQLLHNLANSVRSGDSLSDAMAQHQKVFSPLYLSMIRVGETGGILEQTTTQLADVLNRDEKIKSNMKNAAAYPIFILCIGLISVIIVLTWILPRILATISGGLAALPWPTQILMALSAFIKSYGWLVALFIVAAFYYLKKWVESPHGRLKWDTIKLKVPVLGNVLRTIAVGRFTRTLGALTKGGVSILEALGVVRDTLGNELLARQIDTVAAKVKTGESLAKPLAKSGHFPPLLVQITSIGEQTGKLDELLLNAAETFEGEADAAITKFMAVFPAILILLLALVIGFIIAATLLPIVVMELGAGGL